MTYTPIDFTSLKGIKGFSDESLDLHFALYQGYVRNTNALLDELRRGPDDDRGGALARAELRRRLGWEWNGMRLHELYFGNLGGTGELAPSTELHGKIVKQFGSYVRFGREFQAAAETRGAGWVILYYDPLGDRLFNSWIGEHDVAHLGGGVPLLVMDLWEHAFLIDYRADKSEYVDAFLAAVDWTVVCMRLQTGLESRALTVRA